MKIRLNPFSVSKINLIVLQSNLIKNLITRDEFGFQRFYKNNIFVLSQTIHLDPIWSDLKLPQTHLYDNWQDRIVENIMNYSKKQESGVLIILDDMITCDAAINNRKSNLLKKMFFQGRHYNVSLILVSQKMKEIPPGMRVNATHIICFNLRNQKEEQDFWDENTYIEGIECKYCQATKEQYNFLYIDKSASKAYHNFEKEI